MALTFHYRERYPLGKVISRLALLPGAWNPPTVAHLAIARAALAWADEVILTLPHSMPHKEFDGVSFRDRLELLCAVGAAQRLSVATVEGGLYLEMADEAAAFFDPATEIGLVCGRDAAARIAAWDYGRPGVFDEMVSRYPLLVAERAGNYTIPAAHGERIIHLPLSEAFHEVSSSEIRRRIQEGEKWRDLVPEEIGDRVSLLYSRTANV